VPGCSAASAAARKSSASSPSRRAELRLAAGALKPSCSSLERDCSLEPAIWSGGDAESAIESGFGHQRLVPACLNRRMAAGCHGGGLPRQRAPSPDAPIPNLPYTASRCNQPNPAETEQLSGRRGRRRPGPGSLPTSSFCGDLCNTASTLQTKQNAPMKQCTQGDTNSYTG
jgi:hypothetical protein